MQISCQVFVFFFLVVRDDLFALLHLGNNEFLFWKRAVTVNLWGDKLTARSVGCLCTVLGITVDVLNQDGLLRVKQSYKVWQNGLMNASSPHICCLEIINTNRRPLKLFVSKKSKRKISRFESWPLILILTWLKVGLLCNLEHRSPCLQAPILK